MVDESINCCCQEGSEIIENEITQKVRAYYDSVAEGTGPYDAKENKFSPSGPTKMIIEKIKEYKKKSILDIGCGMGTTLFEIVTSYDDCIKLIGLDFSPKMIERARSRRENLPPDLKKKIGFFTGDLHSLPYMDEEFDFVFSECVINLLSDREKAIKETYRVLKNKGIMIYTDFATHKKLPDYIKEDKEFITGCKAGSILLKENLELVERCKFTNITYVDFTEEKQKNFKELRESNDEIKRHYEEFKRNSPESAFFLEEKIGYYLFQCEKQNDNHIVM